LSDKRACTARACAFLSQPARVWRGNIAESPALGGAVPPAQPPARSRDCIVTFPQRVAPTILLTSLLASLDVERCPRHPTNIQALSMNAIDRYYASHTSCTNKHTYPSTCLNTNDSDALKRRPTWAQRRNLRDYSPRGTLGICGTLASTIAAFARVYCTYVATCSSIRRPQSPPTCFPISCSHYPTNHRVVAIPRVTSCT
jgi:hypothetical protein